MKPGHLGVARRTVQASSAVILFWVGPFRLGIDAGALKEIRNGFLPDEFGHIATLSARALLGVPEGPEGRTLVLRPGTVGLRVDRVERMVETGALRPLPRAFQGAERAWYCGIALEAESVIPIVDPETLAREALSRKSAASELVVQSRSREVAFS